MKEQVARAVATIVDIRKGYDALSVSMDFDEDLDKDAYATILFKPNPHAPEHWHIRLSHSEAIALRDWLTTQLSAFPNWSEETT